LLLARLLAEPWLSLPPPKSTGRDLFHLDWLQKRIGAAAITPADVQATLRASPRAPSPTRCARNCRPARACWCAAAACTTRCCCANWRRCCRAWWWNPRAEKGLDPDFVEAMAFAWLAREFQARRAGNLAAVTGARGPRVLGALYPGANPAPARLLAAPSSFGAVSSSNM
jgi:anhydro-N-acetylmuramic acid kinase